MSPAEARVERLIADIHVIVLAQVRALGDEILAEARARQVERNGDDVARRWHAQQRAADIRRRMRPRHLVKIRCDPWPKSPPRGCGHKLKCLPCEVPARCPECGRAGTLWLVKFVSR